MAYRSMARVKLTCTIDVAQLDILSCIYIVLITAL